ncbi:alpha/beta hydrolase [Neptuniibacter sp.]|uniref:esterase/lipase family protein n=1 Tax=Neptuniibacter sp. TaxID=1962643 RepID=UPI002632500F|nr:alpha/beta hydrolase [Neptuniibacter sp.]
MIPVEKVLVKHGYSTVNEGYPSRSKNIEELANETIPKALEQCPTNTKVNFVTHSMGAILLRQYLAQNSIPNLKRVVMLGPPNQGSEIVDTLGDIPGFHFINGDAGLQLGTGDNGITNILGPASFDLGIIAGTQTINWVLSSFIPGADDGKVSVDRTKLDGMNDHIALPVTHPLMMNNRPVQNQILHYLKYGYFERSSG